MIIAWIGIFTLLSVMVLYILLAFGQPLGEYAMGGKYKVLPTQYRIACAISVIIQLFAVLVLLQLGDILALGIPENIAKGFAYFFGFFLCLNTVMNALSKSRKERMVMTPLSAVTAFSFLYTAFTS